MRLWKAYFFIISCFLTLGCSQSHQHPLAICAMFKNEAPWLKEWLTYHHEVLGVDHFYLYNNDSTDGYYDVLLPFINQGIVELFDWDSKDPSHLAFGPFMDAPWSACQLGAYNDCLKKRALGNAKWVAVIDIDEYIVPAQGVSSFYALLKDAEQKKKGTIRLHWKVFGTSDVSSLSDHDLLIEKLTWRSLDSHPWNRLFKSIHQPEAISFCLVHKAEKLNKKFRKKTISPELACIHHYWTRTSQFCLEKRKMSKESSPEFFDALHQIEDPTILQYVPILKKGMQSLNR